MRPFIYNTPPKKATEMIRITIYLVLAGLLAATVYFAVRKIMRFVSKIRNRLAHRFVAIDFETANSNRASVCALGMVLFEKGTCIRRDYWLIDPECEFDIANVHIHHITPDQIEGKPNFKKIWKTSTDLQQKIESVIKNLTK